MILSISARVALRMGSEAVHTPPPKAASCPLSSSQSCSRPSQLYRPQAPALCWPGWLDAARREPFRELAPRPWRFPLLGRHGQTSSSAPLGTRFYSTRLHPKNNQAEPFCRADVAVVPPVNIPIPTKIHQNGRWTSSQSPLKHPAMAKRTSTSRSPQPANCSGARHPLALVASAIGPGELARSMLEVLKQPISASDPGSFSFRPPSTPLHSTLCLAQGPCKADGTSTSSLWPSSKPRNARRSGHGFSDPVAAAIRPMPEK